MGTKAPRTIGHSDNPFGAGAAACLAAANLFRGVFRAGSGLLDAEAVFSVLDAKARASPARALSGSLGAIVLVGVGAIGNAAAWALSRTPMPGLVHLVDHEVIDLGNLQRYGLAERTDETKSKVSVIGRYFLGPVSAQQHVERFEDFVASRGYSWARMLLALDSARDRRAAQASLPQWIANAWTQPGDLGVSSHDFLDGACVSCLYLPDQRVRNEDEIIAASFGVPDRLVQVRTLLYTGEGVPAELLHAIASALGLPVERLMAFEGRPVRTLYTEGFCGGAVIPLGEAGTPRQDVHVPLAHQSALAGILLAAAAVCDALGLSPRGTHIARVDLMRPLSEYTLQPAAKNPRGMCICQDQDYRDAYKRKYGA